MLGISLLLSMIAAIRLTDVAGDAGIHFRHVSGGPGKNYLLEAMSGGVAWIDYDCDGWPDLYLVNGGFWEDLGSEKRRVSNALFRNNHDGTFVEVTAKAGVSGSQWGMGATVGDYNNDGWPDLYVCNYGRNTLFRNNGDGTFTDFTEEANVGGTSWSSSAAFGDYDADGWIDLYVTNYVKFDYRNPPPPRCHYRGIQVACGPEGLYPEPDVLYHNEGDGTFTDVTQDAGVLVDPAFGLGAVWGDYDNDDDIDLYVANDSMGNFLFQNQGNGRFREVGLISGVACDENGKDQASMGVSSGDYDRDGFLDLYVTNFSDDYNTLYRNLGNGLFRDVTFATALGFPTLPFLGWGTAFADLDNDGWEDIWVANGHLYPQVDRYEIGIHYLQRSQIFRNLGTGRFEEMKGWLQDEEVWSSRGAAVADFDNDGDLDVATNNLDGPASLHRNDGANRNGHWLTLALEGVRTNRAAIGVRVTAKTGTATQMREVRGGSSYQATNDFRLHFGLGAAQSVSELSVRWTDGTKQKFTQVATDRHYKLREGEKLVAHLSSN